jgi:hypothetical protein
MTLGRRAIRNILLGAASSGLAVWWFAGPPAGPRAGPASGGVDPSTIAEGAKQAALDGSHTPVTFALLASFPFDLARMRSARSFIPADVLRFEDRAVRVDGFMLPLDFDGGGVSRFILNPSFDMCAYGMMGGPHERIDVEMTGGRRTIFTHVPIRVYGVLAINDWLPFGVETSLYRLKAEAIGPAGR